MMEISVEFDYSIRSPASIVIAGASMSGKSELVKQIKARRDEVIRPNIEKVIYMYGEHDDRMLSGLRSIEPNINFVKGIEPLIDDTVVPEGNKIRTLLVLDDLADLISENVKHVEKLFTKYVNHRLVTVIFVTQHFFYKNLRVITLQAHYLCIFKNPRDSCIVNLIGRQMNGGRKHKVLEVAYADLASKKYVYVFIDLTQEQNDAYRIRSSVFPDSDTVIYTGK